MIRLEHVTKKFTTKGNEVIAVNDVSLDINKGEIFGIIGFSGCLLYTSGIGLSSFCILKLPCNI